MNDMNQGMEDYSQDENILDKFGRDVNKEVKSGKIDPVIGRDEEIRKVIQILARKTKNNGATVLNIYYCYSANMGKMPTSPIDLRGVGAQDYNTLLYRVSRIIGEQISQDNFKLAKTIRL